MPCLRGTVCPCFAGTIGVGITTNTIAKKKKNVVMVPGAARLAGHPAADFQEWKIRRAVKLGRELGAKAVEVCGVKLYFPHPVGSAELQAGGGVPANEVPARAASPSRRRGYAGTGAGAANAPAHDSVVARLGACRQGDPSSRDAGVDRRDVVWRLNGG